MIRPVEPGDRGPLRALQQTLRYCDPDLVDAAIEGPFFGVVATSDSAPVGYAIGFPGDPTTLSELVVATSHRRQGHGQALVDAIGSMSGGSIVVYTPAENQAAQQFYTAAGFERREYRPDFYDDGTDALGLTRCE